MRKVLLLALLSVVASANAQDAAIIWQNTIGGTGQDILNSFEPTPDGGSILAGYSQSGIGGDKSEASHGGEDIWIVKIDSGGAIQWQNTIGGAGNDFVNVVKPLADGGYIVIAGSDSNISGDKTQDSRGGLDFWILKLDSGGNILWQKTYGGSAPDFDAFGEELPDGNFIIGGYSDSMISGDKTDASNGQRDFWVMKLNSTGNIIWQNSIGGSLVDRMQAIIPTPDNGFLAAGFSTSGISGDKSEASRGGTDYWLVKLGADGQVLWDRTYGGSGADALRDVIADAAGGFIAAGYSISNISGDKTQNSRGNYDYWIIKVDADGNLVWQNTIGGSALDYPRDIKQLSDNSILVAGYSESPVSGDKTNPGNGLFDNWLVQLNSSGEVIAQKCLGGSTDESGPYIYAVPDGFVMACSSTSGISGDKSEASLGADDYWVFRTSNQLLDIPAKQVSNAVLSPNPTTGELRVDFQDNGPLQIYVTDVSGKTFYSGRHSGGETSIHINGLAGLYFVRIENGQKTSTYKVVKY